MAIFDQFSAKLVGLPVSHVWRGYGSAIFVEFGDLRSAGRRRDGTERHPDGEMGLGIEWSWRIERPRSILCGSFSDEATWPKAFNGLLGGIVEKVTLFGRLPEIDIGLSNGLHIASFMTAAGQPDWTLFDRRAADTSWVTIRRGRVVLERAADLKKARAAQ